MEEQEQVITYTIQPGETIRSIADKFETTPKHLFELNNNQPLIIQANKKLRVPLPDTDQSHLVTHGECVQDLLIRFKLTPEELINLNRDLFLLPGQIVKIKR